MPRLPRTRTATSFLQGSKGKSKTAASSSSSSPPPSKRAKHHHAASSPSTSSPTTTVFSASEIKQIEKELYSDKAGGRKSTEDLTPFQRRVYAITKRIPMGYVSTYGAIAESLGNPRAHRAVGNALRHNPFAPVVPCHRVLGSGGKMGGFGGSSSVDSSLVTRKRNMLEMEGVKFEEHGRCLLLEPEYRSRVMLTHIDAKGLDKELDDQHLRA